MSKTTIRTNRHWRPFSYRYEVPEAVLADQFDYLTEEDSDSFFKYLGTWYHISEFMRYGVDGWDGCAGDSFFSGTLIKLSSDGEEYQVARIYS